MNIRLTKTRIRAGHWEGLLSGTQGLHELEVVLLGELIQGVTVAPLPDSPGDYSVRVPVPPEALNEGVQTFLIRIKGGDTLTHFTIITGVAMEDDLRAEVDLLRAELDMLKRVFRMHCVQTAA